VNWNVEIAGSLRASFVLQALYVVINCNKFV